MHAKSDMSQLVRMMPLAVLVPTNALLGLIMPASGLTEKQHQPFTHSVTIEKMEDRIDVMTSLQRPKKVYIYKSFTASLLRDKPPVAG